MERRTDFAAATTDKELQILDKFQKRECRNELFPPVCESVAAETRGKGVMVVVAHVRIAGPWRIRQN